MRVWTTQAHSFRRHWSPQVGRPLGVLWQTELTGAAG
jgi:hypothetical protein